MSVQSRRIKISVIKELIIKLRQHGECTRTHNILSKFAFMLRNTFPRKRVFFSWIEEKRKEVGSTLLYLAPTSVKAGKGWAGMPVGFQTVDLGSLGGLLLWEWHTTCKRVGVGWEWQSSTYRDAPVYLFSILDSPQKLLFEESVPQLISTTTKKIFFWGPLFSLYSAFHQTVLEFTGSQQSYYLEKRPHWVHSHCYNGLPFIELKSASQKLSSRATKN